jgi:hypothetical protein
MLSGMNTSVDVSIDRASTIPVSDALVRWFLAVAVMVTPLVMMTWFALCPQYGNPACPTTATPLDAIVAFRGAPGPLLRLFLDVNLVVPYLFPLGFIGIALVAWRRAPWVTMLGLVFGWVSSIAWGYIADSNFMISRMATGGHDAEFAALYSSYISDLRLFVGVGGGWVLGHLFAYLLLGIALLRARVVPVWSGLLLVAAVPIMGPLAYGFGSNALQLLGYLMVAAACLPVARQLARRDS